MEDHKAVRDNYIVLVAGVLVEHLAILHPLRSVHVPKHVLHQYSTEMSQKSDITSYANHIYVPACVYLLLDFALKPESPNQSYTCRGFPYRVVEGPWTTLLVSITMDY